LGGLEDSSWSKKQGKSHYKLKKEKPEKDGHIRHYGRRKIRRGTQGQKKESGQTRERPEMCTPQGW